MRDWEVAPSLADACSWPSVNYQLCVLFILMVDLSYATDMFTPQSVWRRSFNYINTSKSEKLLINRTDCDWL